jgi:hypothetical protein
VARRRPRGEEQGARAGGDRAQELVEPEVDDRPALDVAARDEVERDVDAAGLGGDRVGVLVDRALVERVDDGDAGAAALGGDVGGEAVERLARAAGRCTAAPSRANVRATARPRPPPAPWRIAVLD